MHLSYRLATQPAVNSFYLFLFHHPQSLVAMSGRIAGAQSSTSFSIRRLRRLLRKHLLSVNLLLVCVPLTFITAALQYHDVIISLLSFLAIIPLSALVSDASDTVGDRWGAIIGGLVNATFGNTVELIVSKLS